MLLLSVPEKELTAAAVAGCCCKPVRDNSQQLAHQRCPGRRRQLFYTSGKRRRDAGLEQSFYHLAPMEKKHKAARNAASLNARPKFAGGFRQYGLYRGTPSFTPCVHLGSHRGRNGERRQLREENRRLCRGAVALRRAFSLLSCTSWPPRASFIATSEI